MWLVKFKKENRKSQVSSESHADYNDDHELNSEQCQFFSNFLQLPGGVHWDSILKSKTIVSDFSWITLKNKGSHTGSKKNQLFKI